MRHLLTIFGIILLAACQTKGGGTGTSGTKVAGAECSSNQDCVSGACGSSGSGHCCAAPCTTGDATCGATTCDANGACVYPALGATCGPTTCTGETFTNRACDGAGSCDAGSAACPGYFACATSHACMTSCSGDTDCRPGDSCMGRSCSPPLATGACTEDKQCQSAICGVDGTGNCCTEACANAAPCGAIGCDAHTGACLYPDAGTTCGSVAASCSLGLENLSGLCDGYGACVPGQSYNCFPYACSGLTCGSSCTSDLECQGGPGNFCDTTASACCGSHSGGLAAGTTLAVDAVAGDDATACCGIGVATPCRTLAHAMDLIAAAQATAVILHATVDGGGGDWAPAGEVYPITLDLGVQLLAPGVFFSDSASHPELFDIVSANGFTASIVGTDAKPVTIGMDSKGSVSSDPVTIEIEPSTSLAIAGAAVFGSTAAQNTAIAVASHASLTLGSAIGSRNGTVHVGGAPPAPAGWIGIDCQGGCEVTDGTLTESSVVIAGQQSADLQVADGATVYLTSSPVIGVAPNAVGFHNCTSKVDASAGKGAAVSLTGNASVIFQNGTVQCIAGSGFSLAATGSDVPSLNLKNTLVQNTERAIYAPAGSATVSGSTIRFNYDGVVATTDGVHNGFVDLNGTAQSSNTVVCSSRIESVDGGAPGVSLFNDTGASLPVANVAWDTSGPDVFDCNDLLTSCSCSSTCSVTAGGDSMEIAVVGVSSVSTSGATVSLISCASPP